MLKASLKVNLFKEILIILIHWLIKLKVKYELYFTNKYNFLYYFHHQKTFFINKIILHLSFDKLQT